MGEENKGWAHFNQDLAKLKKEGDVVPVSPGLDMDDLIPSHEHQLSSRSHNERGWSREQGVLDV